MQTPGRPDRQATRLETQKASVYNEAVVFVLLEAIAMTIELTDEQQRAVEQGKPVEVIDPATVRTFVVLAREQYERVRWLLEKTSGQEAVSAGTADVCPIPPGIRRSQEAYWRDLPNLLKR